MSGRTDAHEHEHEHQAVNWFGVLDILVWAAVAVLVALAVEWLVGYVVRERLARGADRFLAKHNAAAAAETE